MDRVGMRRAACLRGMGLAALLFPLLSGCGAVRTWNATDHRYDNGNASPARPVHKNPAMQSAAQHYGLMALFADLVYRNEWATGARQANTCRYLDTAHVHETDLNLPEGWTRWLPEPGKPLDKIKPCLSDTDTGLSYETFVYQGKEGAGTTRFSHAVIAFRGTENDGGQLRPDWAANLASAFGFASPQHEQAWELIRDLANHLSTEVPPGRLYATGHSLGGGLAQQAGYMSPHISEVFAFNSSPVTYWTRLRERKGVQQAFPFVHRVHVGGEAAGSIRIPAGMFTREMPHRTDITLRLPDELRNPVDAHGIRHLTCAFAETLHKAELKSRFPYSESHVERCVVQQAHRKLSNNNQRSLCDVRDQPKDQPQPTCSTKQPAFNEGTVP